MTDLPAMELRRIRHEARRQLLSILCDEADDVAQVGKRCVLLARLHGAESVRGKSQRDLAAFLGITEGRFSQRLKFLRQTLL